MSRPEPVPRAVILGCAGPTLGADERDFFAGADPLGFILFKRNCRDPGQVRALVEALRAAVGRPDAPVLIDQEGGRVARLAPPRWPAAPAAARFGDLARRDRAGAVEATRLNARLIACELRALGITVDCYPVVDVRDPGGHDVIGDRAFSDDPAIVAELGRGACEGLRAGGVAPVIKHLPGHGRAGVDSHRALPVVGATRETLEQTDFLPFRALADAGWGMTGHVVYTAIDAHAPATTSATVVERVIRDHMGFDGLLMTDDLSMDALEGSLGDRAAAALAAGCDVALHCNGRRTEMAAVVDAVGPLSAPAEARLARAQALPEPERLDVEAARARLEELLGGPAEARP